MSIEPASIFKHVHEPGKSQVHPTGLKQYPHHDDSIAKLLVSVASGCKEHVPILDQRASRVGEPRIRTAALPSAPGVALHNFVDPCGGFGLRKLDDSAGHVNG